MLTTLQLNWRSPDGRFEKQIIKRGVAGTNKPTERAKCAYLINDTKNKSELIIGFENSDFERNISILLQTMCTGEVSQCKAPHNDNFKLKLVEFQSAGMIYEWPAGVKHNLAQELKTAGNANVKKDEFNEAGYKYRKALKYLLSIPMDVEHPPSVVDGVTIAELTELKVALYNNLALCAFKSREYDRVLRLCEKCLDLDTRNVKATYKIGESHYFLGNYELAMSSFKEVLNREPHNRAAFDYVQMVQGKIKEEKIKYNEIVKKMFR
ncbi:peptidyl-prolyl cis-trans isomerase FKBP5-like [Atheta coriaria]|uniref:peptidyl-prolyl cis-trans isomerase FKBP5-like n=1 Tax=Dalotia coriaria TaxID=877792 RepID=UPI0031F41795